jgi:Mn2+/Fe2+ NRAMP family transporter
VAEAAGWRGSLDLRLDKGEGRGFYGVLTAATAGGVALCFTSIDPVRALFWSAVVNGVIAVPIMSVMMIIAARPQTMGEYAIDGMLKWLGWGSTAVMGLTVAAMFASA